MRLTVTSAKPASPEEDLGLAEELGEHRALQSVLPDRGQQPADAGLTIQRSG
ncbi:MAG: hypothetical protein ACOCXM_06685 [Myxococcota bacterium]